jgi:hypothetical protein
MFIYSCYGLLVHSTLAFPELPLAEVAGNKERIPDVTIVIRSISDLEMSVADDAQNFCGEVTTPKIDRFLVSQGKHIIIDSSPDVAEGALRAIILGPIFTILLRQRRLLVLHASGVSVLGNAVAFLGCSGWGKSTLANALYNRGHILFTDDVTAIRLDDKGPITFPAYPNVKLLPDAASALGYDFEALTPLFKDAPKRHNHLDRFFPNKPFPLRKIYVLEKVGHNRHEIEPLQPQKAVLEVIRHTRGTNVLTTSEDMGTHLRQCAQLVQAIPICRLKRCHSLDQIPELIELIESDIADSEEQRQRLFSSSYS